MTRINTRTLGRMTLGSAAFAFALQACTLTNEVDWITLGHPDADDLSNLYGVASTTDATTAFILGEDAGGDVRVWAVDLQNGTQPAIGTPTQSFGGFLDPVAVTGAPDHPDSVWVLHRDPNWVIRWDKTLTNWDSFAAPSVFNEVHDITVDLGGDVYVAGRVAGGDLEVHKRASSGTTWSHFATLPSIGTARISADPAGGNMVALNASPVLAGGGIHSTNKLLRISASGTIVEVTMKTDDDCSSTVACVTYPPQGGSPQIQCAALGVQPHYDVDLFAGKALVSGSMWSSGFRGQYVAIYDIGDGYIESCRGVNIDIASGDDVGLAPRAVDYTLDDNDLLHAFSVGPITSGKFDSNAMMVGWDVDP